MILSEPQAADVFPAFIGGDLIRRKMSVVVDDGLVRSHLMEEAFGGSAVEQEVVVEEGSRHDWTLEFSAEGVNRNLHASGIMTG